MFKIPAMMFTLYEIVYHPFHKGFLGGMASEQNYTNFIKSSNLSMFVSKIKKYILSSWDSETLKC